MNSEDKQAIKDIVNKLVPNAEEYMAAYAYWELKNFGGGGRTITTTTRMVNAKAGESWASFYDLEGKEIVSLAVIFYNTKSDKYHPVNIQQKEEQEAFAEFVRDFMAEVNGYRQVTVSGKPLKPLDK